MQSAKFADALDQTATLLRPFQTEGPAQALNALAAAFRVRTQSVSAVLGKVAKALQDGPPSNQAAALSRQLQQVAQLFEKAGAGPVSKDFAQLSEIVGRMAEVDFAEVNELFEKAFAPPVRTKKSTAKAARNLDGLEIRNIADQLTAVTNDATGFASLLETIKLHSKDDLSKIASHYLGYERNFKSKSEILKAIKGRHVQEAIFESKQRSLQRP